MSFQSDTLEPAIAKLARWAPLDEADRESIRALPYEPRTIEPSAYLIREGEAPKRCGFILSGFAYRHKLTAGGARQIVAILVPGDFYDLQNLYLSESDHNVQALTRLAIVEFTIDTLRKLVDERPTVGRAMWVDGLVEASIFREWVVNVGRRDARARIGHLLCEFAYRMRTNDTVPESYELPMTQEQLADAVGLTPVHVNRVLRSLSADGLIARDRRHIRAADWARLKDISDFSARYLHINQGS